MYTKELDDEGWYRILDPDGDYIWTTFNRSNYIVIINRIKSGIITSSDLRQCGFPQWKIERLMWEARF